MSCDACKRKKSGVMFGKREEKCQLSKKKIGWIRKMFGCKQYKGY